MNRKKTSILLVAILIATVATVASLQLMTVECPHCHGSALEPMDVKLLSHRMEHGGEGGQECYIVYAHVVNLGAPGKVTMWGEIKCNLTPLGLPKDELWSRTKRRIPWADRR